MSAVLGEERQGRWMVIRRTSGKVVELSTVWVSSSTRPRRNRRKGTTTAQKQDANERDCVKQLARAINCNFQHGDLLLTVKYDNEGAAELEERGKELAGEMGTSLEDGILEAAQADVTNYVRRLGRRLKKDGVELKYIICTADMDGETGEMVRVHHHIILPRVSFEEAAKAWKHGSVEYQILREQDDYTQLAVYLCRQVRRRPDRKKYRCSRNLKKPIVNERWAKPGELLKPDRFGKVVARNQWEEGGPQYIRFIKGAPLPAGRGQRKKQEEREESRKETATGGGGQGRGGTTGEIRCRGCGKLLAVRHENGMIESRAGKLAMWAERAVLCCPKCGEENDSEVHPAGG